MTITDWIEAKEHASLVASKGGKREWTAPYILTSDNPRDDAKTCVDFMDTIGRGLSDSFRYGDREDSLKFCKQITATRIPSSAVHWQVICTYSELEPRDGVDDDDEPTENPIDWRYDISCGTQFYQVPVYKAWNVDAMPLGGAGFGYIRAADILGPVHNSAGVVYDPPLTRDVPETVVRISGNAPQYWAAMLSLTVGTINQFGYQWSDLLCSKYGFVSNYFHPYCVLCSAGTADYRIDNDIRYWRYTFEFRLRTPADDINPQDGFLETILDRGLCRLAQNSGPDGAGGHFGTNDLKEGMAEIAAIRDIADRRVPEMTLLDGHGQPLHGSDTLAAPPVYFRWRIHPYGVFSYPYLPLDMFKGA